jgi:hypothetical protein
VLPAYVSVHPSRIAPSKCCTLLQHVVRTLLISLLSVTTTCDVQEARQDLVVVAGGREMLRDAMLRALVNREIFTANNLLVRAALANIPLRKTSIELLQL